MYIKQCTVIDDMQTLLFVKQIPRPQGEFAVVVMSFES